MKNEIIASYDFPRLQEPGCKNVSKCEEGGQVDVKDFLEFGNYVSLKYETRDCRIGKQNGSLSRHILPKGYKSWKTSGEARDEVVLEQSGSLLKKILQFPRTATGKLLVKQIMRWC